MKLKLKLPVPRGTTLGYMLQMYAGFFVLLFVQCATPFTDLNTGLKVFVIFVCAVYEVSLVLLVFAKHRAFLEEEQYAKVYRDSSFD